MSPEPYDPSATDRNIVCVTCGTQFPTPDQSLVPTCPICDDPRQYVPDTGQLFTTMLDIRQSHHNEFRPLHNQPLEDSELVFIASSPKFAIAQRAILVRTPAGNILWDCVTLIDRDTVDTVNRLGGLKAIVISHPHFYSSHAEWSRAFGGCPVYLSTEDYRWVQTPAPPGRTVFLAEGETEKEIEVTGCRAIKLGGHFPGSLVLLTPTGRLLVADTLLTTPAGVGKWETDALGRPRRRPDGMNTFAFMWSIPNWIPLSGEEIFRMWSVLKEYDFKATHGGFVGQDIEDERIKERVLESMQIQTRAMAWTGEAQWQDV